MVSNYVSGAARCTRGADAAEPARSEGRSEAGRSEPASSEPAQSLQASARRAPAGEESTEDILRRYRRRGSQILRDRLVERHLGIVESMARGLAARLPRTVDTQDLVHAGMWGLMQAIAAYQPARCDQFTAFLRIRVRGAMLDELRHMDFLPRLFRRRLRDRSEATAKLRATLEREPSDAELATELGISEAVLARRYEPFALRMVQTAQAGDDDRMEQLADEALESPIEVITRQELLDLIRASLEPVEWKVLHLHYFEGMTGRQVARRLRLSASRICQIHGKVLDRLKAQLSPGAV